MNKRNSFIKCHLPSVGVSPITIIWSFHLLLTERLTCHLFTTFVCLSFANLLPVLLVGLALVTPRILLSVELSWCPDWFDMLRVARAGLHVWGGRLLVRSERRLLRGWQLLLLQLELLRWCQIFSLLAIVFEECLPQIGNELDVVKHLSNFHSRKHLASAFSLFALDPYVYEWRCKMVRPLFPLTTNELLIVFR